MAAVDTLPMLELLYLVNADVEVPALDVVLIELRQLLEVMELALDAKGRPLRVLFGEVARSFLRSRCGLVDKPGGPRLLLPPLLAGTLRLLILTLTVEAAGEALGRRPRGQGRESSEDDLME